MCRYVRTCVSMYVRMYIFLILGVLLTHALLYNRVPLVITCVTAAMQIAVSIDANASRCYHWPGRNGFIYEAVNNRIGTLVPLDIHAQIVQLSSWTTSKFSSIIRDVLMVGYEK